MLIITFPTNFTNYLNHEFHELYQLHKKQSCQPKRTQRNFVFLDRIYRIFNLTFVSQIILVPELLLAGAGIWNGNTRHRFLSFRPDIVPIGT